MVPAPRLIWLVVAVGFPAAILAAVIPQTQIGALAIMVLLCGIVLTDLALRDRSLQGIRVELPATLRALQKQSMAVPIRIHNPNLRARRLRLGLVAPEGIDALEWEEQEIQLAAGAAVGEVFWNIVPQRRGTVMMKEIFLETSSPLGFWSVRRRDAAALELRVYPNLRQDSALRALLHGDQGVHHMRQVGRGRDFEKLREYAPGDSSDEIHWKATARRGAPITKVFQVERTQEIYIVIDASRLSGRLVENESALDRAIRAALLIGAAAERRGDLFGLAVFSDKVERFIRARAGKSHYAACRDAINDVRTRPRAPDFDAIATFLRLRLRRRALLIFLTALDEPVLSESFIRAAELLARRHLILTGMLQPATARALFQNPEVKSTDDIYRELAGHLAWRHLRELQSNLSRKGIRFALIEPEDFSTRLISLYDEMKQRQLL